MDINRVFVFTCVVRDRLVAERALKSIVFREEGEKVSRHFHTLSDHVTAALGPPFQASSCSEVRNFYASLSIRHA
jgi:hypothetical protein